jgi:hypothetical protein
MFPDLKKSYLHLCYNFDDRTWNYACVPGYRDALNAYPQRGLTDFRGPNFLAVVCFCSTPPPPLFRQQIVSLSQSSYVLPVQLNERGAKSYDSKKASVNRSIFSAFPVTYRYDTGHVISVLAFYKRIICYMLSCFLGPGVCG